MKKTLILIATAAALLIPTARAQTGALTASDTTNILGVVTDFLRTTETVTDWTYLAYASHAKGLKDSKGNDAEWGAGLAALYPLHTSVLDIRGGFRAQWFAGNTFVPSVNAQVGGTYKVFGVEKLKWCPAVWTGMAVAAGGTQQNGDVGVLYGGGVSLKYQFSEKLEAGLGYGWEQWSQLNVDRVEHFALVLHFKF